MNIGNGDEPLHLPLPALGPAFQPPFSPRPELSLSLLLLPITEALLSICVLAPGGAVALPPILCHKLGMGAALE